MITIDYVRTMARYNRWQNANLYGAADTLWPSARTAERGAFFGSIHKTLNHLLWADRMWMSRFAGTERPRGGIPESTAQFEDWGDLKRERATTDAVIVAWADQLDPAWLAGDLTWFSGAAKRDVTKRKDLLMVHFFNHQTHHRGQLHAMLTAAGARPHDTDLSLLPADAGA